MFGNFELYAQGVCLYAKFQKDGFNLDFLQTALHWAAGYGCAVCVQILLRAGADMTAKNVC